MKIHLVSLLAALGLVIGCRDGDLDTTPTQTAPVTSSDRTITTPAMGTQFSELPAAVQKAVRDRAGMAEIADIDKETRTGRVVYEISFKDEGLNPKMHVAEDGTVLDNELNPGNTGVGTPNTGVQVGRDNSAITPPALPRPTTLADLPAAVQKTIRERVPNGVIADIDKETRTARVVYEIQFKDEGLNPKLHVAEDGTIVEDLNK